MKNLKLIVPKFNPPSMNIGGVVAPTVLPKSTPIVRVLPSSNLDKVNWGSVILTCAAVGAIWYLLNQQNEVQSRERENTY